MTGDCHVRFCESGGLGCPLPLTVKKHPKKHHKSKKRQGKLNAHSNRRAGK